MMVALNKEKMMNRKQEETKIIKELNELLPECKATSANEFYNNKDIIGIWFKGSEGTAKDGTSIYYETYDYEICVHPVITKVLNKYEGWETYPYDSGTLMAEVV